MRSILIGLAFVVSTAGLAAPVESGDAGSVRAETGADGWQRLEAEQEQRRRRREAALSEPKAAPVQASVAAAPRLRAAVARVPRAVEPPKARVVDRPVSARPRRERPEPVPQRVSRPKVQVAAASAAPGGKAAACYGQVGIQVDATGRPLRGYTLSDSRSQDAFIRCIDGR